MRVGRECPVRVIYGELPRGEGGSMVRGFAGREQQRCARLVRKGE